MPHIPIHPSARKRHRQSVKRELRNHTVKSRARSAAKSAAQSISGSDRAAAEKELRAAIKELSKAASKGVLHRNTAARKIARLSRDFHRAHKAGSGAKAS